MKVNEIRNVWTAMATRLEYEKRDKVSLPEDIVQVVMNDLLPGKVLHEMVTTYQEVFGDCRAWKEGARCTSCLAQICLSAYRANGDLACACGGRYEPCHPPEVVEMKIVSCLSRPGSVVGIAEADEENGVAGFAWGHVANPPEISTIMAGDLRPFTRRSGQAVKAFCRAMKERGLEEGRFLYLQEMGVLAGWSRGVQPALGLLRLCLERAGEGRAGKLVFWTSTRSPLLRIAPLLGCETVHATDDGIYFEVLPDAGPLLFVLQHAGERELRMLFHDLARVSGNMGKDRARGGTCDAVSFA